MSFEKKNLILCVILAGDDWKEAWKNHPDNPDQKTVQTLDAQIENVRKLLQRNIMATHKHAAGQNRANLVDLKEYCEMRLSVANQPRPPGIYQTSTQTDPPAQLSFFTRFGAGYSSFTSPPFNSVFSAFSSLTMSTPPTHLPASDSSKHVFPPHTLLLSS